ncbi:hypothetical protein TrRE_jg544, partial [Triparma retinervis]
MNLHVLAYKTGLSTFYFPKSDPLETTDPEKGTHVWRAVEGFFNTLDVAKDSDADLFVQSAIPALDEIVRIPNLKDQQGPNYHRPLTPKQKGLVQDRVEGILKLITRSKSQSSFTPSSHAQEILSEDVSAEDEEFVKGTVEREFSMAKGMVDASMRLRSRLERAVSRRTKGTTVSIYGSGLAEMATHKSDVDLSIYIPELEHYRKMHRENKMGNQQFLKKQKDAVYGVRDDLVRANFTDVQPIPFARIPLVKCVDPLCQNPNSPTGSLHGDVCFNNEIAVRNSFLLREYARFDVRCKMLMMAVKLFIKARGIGDAPNGTPSSYCWMNMVIYYCQIIGVVPNLQDRSLYEMEDVPKINGLDVSFAKAEEARRTWVAGEDDGRWTLGKLLKGFFRYYAVNFDVRRGVVSIRVGGRAPRGALDKSHFPRSRPFRMCVEDPFESVGSLFVHDLGMVIGEMGAVVVREELEGAMEIVEGVGWEGLFEQREKFNGRDGKNAKRGPPKAKKVGNLRRPGTMERKERGREEKKKP